jgi:hypothetical protein
MEIGYIVREQNNNVLLLGEITQRLRRGSYLIV